MKKNKMVLCCILTAVLVLVNGGLYGFAQPVQESGTLFNELSEPDTIMFGDTNGDGIVNSTDYILVSRYILGTISSFPYDKGIITADTNADGFVNSTDSSLIKRYVLDIISKFPAEAVVQNMPQKVFEFNYTNHAWAYYNRGWYIDNSGNIYYYDYAKEPKEEKLIGSISKKELVEKFLYLLKASNNEKYESYHRGFDMGALTYKGYVPGAAVGEEKEVVLFVDGDWVEYNTCPFAKSLVDWMKSLEETYPEIY
ncbi:MAG: dockerin type I repeat-containing protein [Bacillota bacterium]